MNIRLDAMAQSPLRRLLLLVASEPLTPGLAVLLSTDSVIGALCYPNQSPPRQPSSHYIDGMYTSMLSLVCGMSCKADQYVFSEFTCSIARRVKQHVLRLV